jgi:CYTH domain-containing protein
MCDGVITLEFTYKCLVDGATVEIETDICESDFEKLSKVSFNHINKCRVKIHDGDNMWDIDFFKNKKGEIYLALAEVEMPESCNYVPAILPILEPYAVFWVEKNDSRFASKNLSDEVSVKQMLKELTS